VDNGSQVVRARKAFLSRGAFHSGPLSAIHYVGIIGLALYILLIAPAGYAGRVIFISRGSDFSRWNCSLGSRRSMNRSSTFLSSEALTQTSLIRFSFAACLSCYRGASRITFEPLTLTLSDARCRRMCWLKLHKQQKSFHSCSGQGRLNARFSKPAA